MIHRMVWFAGKLFWLHNEDDDEDGALLSPLHHYSEDGEMLADPFRDLSFAVIVGGEIRRHCRTIGLASDLIDAKDAPEI